MSLPDCAFLTEDITEPHWLTIPNSRLVVNPWDVTQRAAYDVPSSIAHRLPLNLAYHFGETPVRLPYFLAWDVPIPKTASWAPHRIVEGGITTFLPDESTVAQSARLTGPVILKGYFSNGDVRWEERALMLFAEGFYAAVTFSAPVRWLGVDSGIWSVEIKSVEEIAVAIRFDSGRPNFDFREALAAREADWNNRLTKVPRPQDFTLHYIKRDVTPEALERMYYKAWVFTISNSLPPMLENDFPYPQVSCGKASLWAEGHPKCAPSAQWESFVAMQLMAWVDPELAWNSFEGMMSLVDEEGTLGGEGLPSRHVQTAWVLYALTGDKDRLRRVYPAMKRMLIWKASDPRWIFKEQTPPGLKDAEFVVHALMDMFWARRICEVLDMPEEIGFWNGWIDRLKQDYRRWFWETPGGSPNFTYHEELGRRSGDRHSWCLSGLGLPEIALGELQKQSLLELFRSMLDENVPFLVFGLNKFPQCNFAMVGLWQYGRPEEVVKMAEGAMTAVTMAGEFAECYGDTFPAFVWGVTPSMFGAASMIDSALWHNGILIGDGLPIIAHTPDAVGVENLSWKGCSINVRYDGDEVELSGSALERLNLPDGFTECDDSRWRGHLPVGKQVTLGEN